MGHQATFRCGQHPDPFDCPDRVVFHHDGEYGLIIHDGGSAVIGMAFCPWCGAALAGDHPG
jgi:hypothetical protein